MKCRVALLEPFHGGSHRLFSEGLIRHSMHEFERFSLADRHWKWRMSHAAVDLAEVLLKSDFRPDLVLTNDMLDVAQLRGFLHQAGLQVPVLTYFHENQFAYPVSELDKDAQNHRDHHYRLLNYTSALASDGVAFNSRYNQESFLGALPSFLQQFPDGFNEERIQGIRSKSRVLPLGLNLKDLDESKTASQTSAPLILWNHRWSYDKDPELFFRTLMRLKQEDIPFQLAVLGKGSQRSPSIFETARDHLADRLVHWGWVSDRRDYARWLWKADLLPVTSRQDFFGISVVEAVYCSCRPLLPKGLAFSEHLSDEECFYHDPEDFEYRLRNALISPSPSNPRWRKDVSSYDWNHRISAFDEFITIHCSPTS